MFLNDNEKAKQQLHSLPFGYEIVEHGRIQPGDIRWNPYNDSWNLSDPVQDPKHKLVIGDPVTNFHGVCRKKGAEYIFEVKQAPVINYTVVEFNIK